MSRMVLVTFVALLSFSAMLIAGFLQATAAADDATQAGERQLLENHLGNVVQALLQTETVQLTWDDAARAVGGQGAGAQPAPPDLAWADTNLGQFLAHVVKADELYLVTPQGRLLRGWHGGKAVAPASFDALGQPVRQALAGLAQNGSLNEPAAEFRQLADARWPYASGGRPLTRWAGGFVWRAGRPALMTVVAITPDVNYALLRRTPNHVVVLRYVDAAMLREIGGAVLLSDMRFSPMQPPASSERNALALRGIDGQTLGWLSWRPHQVGALVLMRTAPLLAVYLAFFLGVLIVGTLMIRQALRVARELAASEAQAHHHALHDPMLGLPNRAHVMQRLRGMLQAGESAAAAPEGPADAEGETGSVTANAEHPHPASPSRGRGYPFNTPSNSATSSRQCRSAPASW